MHVVEAMVSHPINAMGGFYVLIEGSQRDVYGIAAHRSGQQAGLEWPRKSNRGYT